MSDIHTDPARRHDILFLLDVTDSNPNGDPDAGNAPRTDIDTRHGLISDVSIKRKIRDYLADAYPGDGYDLFVRAGKALATTINAARTATGITGRPTPQQAADAQTWLCQRYIDIRLFGAVLGTGKQDGKATGGAGGALYGPITVGFARSIDPITPVRHAITRVTQTREEDIDKGESTEMGNKWTVPYGLYQTRIQYLPTRGQKTGVTHTDLQRFYEALTMMWDNTASATRPSIATRTVHIFTHTRPTGDAPAHQLFDRITITRTNDAAQPARRYTDYNVNINLNELHDAITHTQLT